MKLLRENNEYILIDSSRNIIATSDETILKASPKKHKLCRNNCNEIFDFVDIHDLGNEYAWLYVQGKGLSKHNMAKQSFIEGFTACHIAEAFRFKATDMIEFATWMNKLTPAQKVSVWSKNGELKGLFTMDEEQLFEKWLHTKQEINVEMLYNRDCYSSAGWCDKLTMAQCIMCTPVYPLKDENDCIILNKL